MPLPFRNPVSSEDDNWEPPSYAKPVDDSNENWKPPEYAKAIESKKEEPKKGVFSKIKDFLTPPDKLDVTKAIPAQAKQFLDEHPTIKAIGKAIIEGPQSKYPIQGPGLSEIPGVRQAADWLRQKGINTGNYALGAAGSIAGDILEGGSTGFDPRTAGIEHAEIPATSKEELPIRQRQELSFKPLTDTTPQQDTVAIAQTRPDIVPRTAPNISTETGIPKASVRRTIGELKKKTALEETPKSVETATEEAPKVVADFIKDNPDAKMSDVEKFIDSVKAAPQEEKPLPTRSPNLDPNLFKIGEDTPQPSAGMTEDKIYNMARERFNMGKELPPPEESSTKPTAEFAFDWPEIGEKMYNIKGGPNDRSTVTADTLRKMGIEVPAEESTIKPDFINPFAKKAPAEVENIQRNAPYGEGSIMPSNVTPTELKTPDENWTPPSYAKASEEPELMSGGLGGIKPPKQTYPKFEGPAGPALDKLFNTMGGTLEKRVQQDVINKAERAKRFASFAGVKEEGQLGAAKQLSTLRGEFKKITPQEGMDLNDKEVDSLFTAVKRAKITEGEKARGYTALFSLLNGDRLPQRNELRILDDVFGNGFADRITEMHGGLGAVGINLSKIANTMKSMQNSISLAAPLRHGIGLIARKEFGPAFGEMFKYFAKPEYYKTAMKAIEDRPNYMLGREGGLFLAKPGSLLSSEEEFLNSYVGRIPVVREMVGASQRAYSGFLNKLRSDTFDNMVKQAKALGNESHTMVGDQIVPSQTTKAIANFINNATGRGSLGRLNNMTNELNMLLWSPRMISSRITMLTNPKIYTDLPKGMRLEGLKSLFGIAALGTTIDTLAAYGGAKVSNNILSSDYGKSRFGSKVIDPWGGFQQYIVGAARFLAGKTDSNVPTNRLKIAGNFLANKESPIASLSHTILTSHPTKGGAAGDITTEYNQKTNVQSEVAKRFTPIFVQDVEDLIKNEPDFANDIGLDTAMTGASLAGMAQEYPEAKRKGSMMFRKLR